MRLARLAAFLRLMFFLQAFSENSSEYSMWNEAQGGTGRRPEGLLRRCADRVST